jgi:hypothetical protein
MSIEMHVFFRGKLPSKAALSRALRELGFPFTIKPATGSLERQSGYMPMLLRRDETGVELDVLDDPDALAEFGDIGVDPSLDRVANFRWAGDMQEAVAGMCCAAALAKLVNGVVFDGEEGVLRSADEAIAFARRHLEQVVKPDSNPQLGTRPAHIRRYLKPLLKLRPDLVLVGRDLIIRPVRHVFRGVYFDRTSDKYAFHIQSFVSAMSGIGGGGGSELDRGLWKVYEPYFEPLLLDTLQNDVFAEIGQARTLPDLPMGDRFLALVLSGRLEEAAEFIESDRTRPVDPDHARSDVEAYRNEIAKRRRALLAHGIAELCEDCHRKERERAEKRKLGDIWEPSPFPVEVSGADRESLASDPLFETTPWVGRSQTLYQELPKHPDEIRFAKDWLRRKSEPKLLVPLTPEEAQEERRRYQHYILAARLDGGQLLCLCYDTGRNCRDPEQRKDVAESPPFATTFRLWTFGSSGVIYADYTTYECVPGLIRLDSVEVCEKETLARTWTWSANLKDGTRTIWDHSIRRERELTPEIALLCQFQMPSFFEYKEFWQRACSVLELEGFGRFI